MAQSEVQICNMALARIGVSQFISSLTEQSNEARVCNLFYGPTRDRVLEEMPWKFATKRVELQLTGTAPDGWGYQYRYPNDCLKAIRIVPLTAGNVTNVFYREPNQTINPKVPYDIMEDEANASRVIVTNEPNAVLEYVKTITDPTVFSPSFTNALAWALAAEVAAPLTADPKYGQAANQSYVATMHDAFSKSMNEVYEGFEVDSPLISGRF